MKEQMKTIRQHVPNFVDGCDAKTNTFKTLEELLNKDWIKRWGQDKFDGVPFWRYSESLYGNEVLLMAEWKNEDDHKWWVIGYLVDSVGLPEFKSK